MCIGLAAPLVSPKIVANVCSAMYEVALSNRYAHPTQFNGLADIAIPSTGMLSDICHE